MGLKKADLIEQAKLRGIEIAQDTVLLNREIELILGTHYFNKHPEIHTWGMSRRLFDLQCPQLCFSFKELKPEEQKYILTSDRWIAEIKRDGARCVTFYHPDYGFEFFSRDISDVTFVPNNYTDKILLIKNGIVRTPQSFKHKFKQSFILDAEVMFDGKSLDTTNRGGTFSTTELNATVSILGSAPERARSIQIEGNILKFYVFDILEFDNKNLMEYPLYKRRNVLSNLLNKIGDDLPFELNEAIVDNKQEFFDRMVAEGQEGIVLKNLDEKYYATSSRNRNVQVKMKRTVSGSKNEDIDAFIIGSIPAKKNSALSVQGLIGGIKIGVYLLDEELGTETEHWIGTISGITDSLRRKMTVKDEEGNPVLNPEYLGRVIKVEGQDISSKNLRLTHCRCLDWNFRIDKSPSQCILTKSFLEEQIL